MTVKTLNKYRRRRTVDDVLPDVYECMFSNIDNNISIPRYSVSACGLVVQIYDEIHVPFDSKKKPHKHKTERFHKLIFGRNSRDSAETVNIRTEIITKNRTEPFLGTR